MIKYFFVKKKGKIKKVNIKGHALYSTKNTDIVCASVSTAIIMTINAIEIFGLKKKISYFLKEGSFILKIISFDEKIDLLLQNLENSFKDLSQNYHQNIQEIKK